MTSLFKKDIYINYTKRAAPLYKSHMTDNMHNSLCADHSDCVQSLQSETYLLVPHRSNCWLWLSTVYTFSWYATYTMKT